MKNIQLPKVTCDSDLAVIVSIDPVENSLMLGLDIETMRAANAKEDVSKCKNNSVVDGLGIKKEINDLSKKCNDTDKVTHIVPFAEFRNGFLPHKSATASEGLLLHEFTL